LKTAGLWDEVMINDLKYFDGSIQKIDRIPQYLKAIYATAFEIDPLWLVNAGSRRQKWIDQSQSLNLMISPTCSPKEVSALLIEGWNMGIKTFYYQRSANPAQELARSILTCASCES
jgi:ribonucleoside-diphosphate reductase alpha chain